MNEGLFVATRWYPRSVHASARYEVYEPDCKLVGAWELKGGNPATTWPGEGHLFIRRYMTGTTWETLLADWPSWKTINRWSFEKGGLVADAGRVLCGMFLSDHFQCRDMATEAPLANPLVVHYGKPMSTSRSGTLALGTDWFALWKPFTEGEHWAHVKRQVLWDFRSGAVVDSWVPESQNGDPSSLRSMGPAIRPFPFMCSLSSTGAFLVEGGNETIRVFRVNRGMRSTR